MINSLEQHISLAKALLYSYKQFNDTLIAKSFDFIILKTTQDFGISREDLYNRIIA